MPDYGFSGINDPLYQQYMSGGGAVNPAAGPAQTPQPAPGPVPGPNSAQQAHMSDEQFWKYMEAQAEWEREHLKEEQARNYGTLAESLLRGATQLQGPQDYFKFLTLTSGGRNLFQQLYGSQPRPTFSAPTEPTKPLTIQDVLNQLGIGAGSPSIGTAAPQAFQQLQQQQGQVSGLDVPGFGKIPYAYQIHPAVWNNLGEQGQRFLKAAAAAAGYDPSQYEQEQLASRPQGRASASTPVRFQAPTSAYTTPAYSANPGSGGYLY